MTTLPLGILSVLNEFVPLFRRRTWKYAKILLIGGILCIGPRTVASVLRVMGLNQEKRFERYHRVLNRAVWSCKNGSKILLGLLIKLLPTGWPIIIGVDDTLERRKGKKIKAKGSYRDPIRSSHSRTVACYGLKWLSMMLIVPVPWSTRPWALPFLTALVPSKQHNESQSKQHKTITHWTIQMVRLVNRWLKKRPWVLIGDGHFGSAKLAITCVNQGVTLISRLRLDARLFDFPKPREPGKAGRPSPAGKRLPTLDQVAADRRRKWAVKKVRWYTNEQRELKIMSGVCLWYASKCVPFTIRWVLVKNDNGKLDAFFSTNPDDDPVDIIEKYIMRWNVEVTFQECRNHLGFETQRQWSDKAIARTTPVILGLYSLVCLMAIKMKVHTKSFIISSAWYVKNDFATFSDILAVVRRRIWSFRYFSRSQFEGDLVKISNQDFNFLINQLARAP